MSQRVPRDGRASHASSFLRLQRETIMKHSRFGVAVLVLVCLAARLPAADPPPLLSAHGAIEKASATSLTILPRDANGKFGKSITLKITGTSVVKTLMPRVDKKGTVMTQKETDVKDLKPKQAIALLYTMVKDDAVLLTAVVQPPAGK
jgi:hypothetical protein